MLDGIQLGPAARAAKFRSRDYAEGYADGQRNGDCRFSCRKRADRYERTLRAIAVGGDSASAAAAQRALEEADESKRS